MTLAPALLAIALAASVAVSGAAQAQAQAPASASPKPKRALIYLAPGEVDASRLLPPPPSEGSPRALAEVAELHRIAAGVSPERMAQARWDDEHENPQMLQPALGAGFDMSALPATAALLSVVQTDADVSASAAKKLFRRRRPWAVDASIKTCDPNDKPVGSYPSGHATLGYALALTMAEVLPEKAQALMTRASDYAYSREVCGSHFASDTQASEALATAVVTELLDKPPFQGQVAAARAELQAHGFAAAALERRLERSPDAHAPAR